MAVTAKQVKKSLEATAPRRPVVPIGDHLSTGISVLNLALSGSVDGGVPKGGYVFLVGDTESGKTWFTLQLFAEAQKNKTFRGHKLILDEPELGAHMDVGFYFGDAVERKLERRKSSTTEDFYFSTYDDLDAGKPFIKVLDSMDALRSKADLKKLKTYRAAWRKGGDRKDEKGSMGMAKAKDNSDNIKAVTTSLADTGSVMVVISQTRDKIGSFIPGEKTHSGGYSLKFYGSVQLWTSVKGQIRRKVAGKVRQVGSLIQVQVKKNRINGWHGKVYVPFYPTIGMDEIGANVYYLCDEGHWDVKRDKSTNEVVSVSAPEFGFEGHPEKLARHVEDGDYQRELQLLVQKVWTEIADACSVKRKPRYS
jgi:RecA/RadA recombinase